MGTGSGSAQDGGIEEWRRAMKKPPPVPGKYTVMLTLVQLSILFLTMYRKTKGFEIFLEKECRQ